MPYLLSEDETILCDEEEASFILGFNSLKYENDSDCSINEDVEEIYQYQKFSELENMDATNPFIYDTDESCKASSQSKGFNELGKDEEHLRMVDSFVEEYELQMLPQRKMNRLRERLSSDCSMNTDDQNDSDAFNIEKVGKLTDSQCNNSSFFIFVRHWFVVHWCFAIELCESWELQQYHCHDEKEPNDDADENSSSIREDNSEIIISKSTNNKLRGHTDSKSSKDNENLNKGSCTSLDYCVISKQVSLTPLNP
jgi:hypothetical protein